MKNSFLLVLLQFPILAYGQLKDSTKTESIWIGQKNYWDRPYLFHRYGAGFQKAGYSELGVTYHQMKTGEMVGLGFQRSVYSTIEWTPTFWPDKPYDIWGVKAGGEFSFVVLSGAIDAKYLSDFHNNNAVFLTPKLGWSFIFLQMYYGYNIPLSNNPFPYIGHHQFSMAIQYSRKFVKYEMKGKPRE